MEENADFDLMLEDDEKIVYQGKFGQKELTAHRIKYGIKAAIALGIVIGGIIFDVKYFEWNIFSFFELGGALMVIVIIALICGITYVKRLVTVNWMEYAVTDQRVLLFDKNGYTSYWYYGIETAAPYGRIYDEHGRVYIRGKSNAVESNFPQPYHGEKYTLTLWNVENPLIVSAHISKYAGTKLHVLDYIGEDRPTDDRFFDD